MVACNIHMDTGMDKPERVPIGDDDSSGDCADCLVCVGVCPHKSRHKEPQTILVFQ
jgi:ferredoxin